jgi:tetrahydromethanopterin S-methyltransferase subunit E
LLPQIRAAFMRPHLCGKFADSLISVSFCAFCAFVVKFDGYVSSVFFERKTSAQKWGRLSIKIGAIINKLDAQ